MLRAHIHQKMSWVTPQGSRIVLVISYPATLKRDIIATVYDLRRSSSSNRSSKTSPLANPKSQTKTCYLSVQANKLISKFTVLYQSLKTWHFLSNHFIIFDQYYYFFKVQISQTICLIFIKSKPNWSRCKTFLLLPPPPSPHLPPTLSSHCMSPCLRKCNIPLVSLLSLALITF